MNERSSSEVRLQSSDPNVPLLLDPKFLSHPYDRRACIEIYREALGVTKHPSLTKDTVAPMIAPPPESDKDILEFWRNNVGWSWHMSGTAKMGKPGNKDAATDSGFRVMGIKGLRVGDLSVAPVLTIIIPRLLHT